MDIDNRDDHTTWLWPAGQDIGEPIEIDPFEIFTNMLENCYENRNYSEEGIDTSDLQGMADYINGLLKQ